MTTEIKVKQVKPLHVLTVLKQLVDQDDVVRALVDLLPNVADVIAGPPMALKLGFPRDGKTNFDLAFPVDQSLTRDGFVTKILPALPMFSITHRRGQTLYHAYGCDRLAPWRDH